MSETNRYRWECTNCGASGETRAVDDAEALRYAKTHSSAANCQDSVEATWVGKAPASPDHDPVNAPKHYRSHPSGIEAIAICEHYGFSLGNALKYIWRAGLKGDAIEDLEKASWYLRREIERRKKEAKP